MSDKKERKTLPAEYENFVFENDQLQKDHREHVIKITGQIETNQDIADNLSRDIEQLGEKIAEIQEKKQNDYLKTFEHFMQTVTKDIKEKIEKMEEVDKMKRKNENFKLIIAERDYFRQEAIRLNEETKGLLKKNEKLEIENKFFKAEIEGITKKWQESEDYNKKLLQEVKKNIEINKQMQNQINITLPKINEKSRMNNQTGLPVETTVRVQNFLSQSEENDFSKHKKKCIEIIETLKEDLKREKIKYNKVVNELSSAALEQKKLEKIFIECIELVQEDIRHRREIKLLGTKWHQSSSAKLIDNTKGKLLGYEHFMDSDKKKLIVNFFLSNDIINLIHEALFNSNVVTREILSDDKIKENYLESTDMFKNKEIPEEQNENDLESKTRFAKTSSKLMPIYSSKKPNPVGLSYNITQRIKTPNIKYGFG